MKSIFEIYHSNVKELSSKMFFDKIKNVKMSKKKIEKSNNVALCVIAKQEEKYLKEYVEHYKSIGFNNILFYDNNELDDNKQYDVLKPYIDEGFVIYHDYRGKYGKKIQKETYQNCVNTYKDEYKWIAFFDADEFLELIEHKNIQEFLNSNKNFENFKGIAINWETYNDNKLIYYEDKPLKERFKRSIKKKKEQIKIILNTNKYDPKIKITTVHRINCGKDICNVLGNNVIVYNKVFIDAIYECAKIRHYKYKTIEEFIKKIKRGDINHRSAFDVQNKEERVNGIIKMFFEENEITYEKIKLIVKYIEEINNDNRES